MQAPKLQCTAPTGFALFILCVCVAVLATVYTSEFFLNMKPCRLCHWQRVPYMIAGVLALISLLRTRNARVQHRLLAACGLVFFCSSLLALYHVGIEAGWLEEPSGCSTSHTSQEDMESTERYLQHLSQSEQATPPCHVAQATLFGFSMAAWNAVTSMLLTVIILFYNPNQHPHRYPHANPGRKDSSSAP